MMGIDQLQNQEVTGEQPGRTENGADPLPLPVLLGASLLLGLIARWPFLTTGLPAGDGGLFFGMVQALRANNYHLPFSLTYNGTEVPFAYPPLGFYLTACASDLLNIDPLQTMRFVGFAFNMLTILFFVLLASRLTRSSTALLFSSIIFPLTVRSYEWVVVGGGITRSPGFAFATLAALAATSGVATLANGLLLGVCVGLAALSHPEWAITAAVGAGLLALSSRQQHTLRNLCIATLVALGITAPWLIEVWRLYGLTPLLAAARTGGHDLGSTWQEFSLFLPFQSSYIPALAWMSILAFLHDLGRRKWLLPLWVLLITLTTPRHAMTALTVPVSILAAQGVDLALRWFVRLMNHMAERSRFRSLREFLSRRMVYPLRNYVLVTLAAVVSVMSVFSAFYNRQMVAPSLTPHTLEALKWVEKNSAPDDETMFFSLGGWEAEYISEWFPVLTAQRSAVLPQGLEWLPGTAFEEKIARHRRLNLILQVGTDELADYIRRHYPKVKFVLFVVPLEDSDVAAFSLSGAWEVISNDRLSLFARRDATT